MLVVNEIYGFFCSYLLRAAKPRWIGALGYHLDKLHWKTSQSIQMTKIIATKLSSKNPASLEQGTERNNSERKTCQTPIESIVRKFKPSIILYYTVCVLVVKGSMDRAFCFHKDCGQLRN